MKKSLALTSTAVAVSVAQSVSAGVIYQDVNRPVSSYYDFYLDINGDSVHDLRFDYDYYSYFSYGRYGGGSSSRNGDLWAYGLSGTQITLGGPLTFGDVIDEDSVFGDSNHMADYYNFYSRSCGRRSCSPARSGTHITGSWNDGYNQVSGYLGFALSQDTDDFLYGWVDLTMNYSGSTVINGFGYETYPNAGITAGATSSDYADPSEVSEPGSLALLALGAAGIAVARKRSKAG